MPSSLDKTLAPGVGSTRWSGSLGLRFGTYGDNRRSEDAKAVQGSGEPGGGSGGHRKARNMRVRKSRSEVLFGAVYEHQD